MLWLIWLVLMLVIAASPALIMFLEYRSQPHQSVDASDSPADAG